MALTVIKQGDRWIARFPFSYETKDVVKQAGFKFDGANKLWYTTDPAVADRLDPAKAEAAVAEANRAIAMSRAVAATITIPAPAGLDYRPFQKAGIVYAMDRVSTLIADDMGLGKTIQAAGVINADPTVTKVLVVCPATLKLNWQLELEKWMVRPLKIAIVNGTWPADADIAIINYDILGKWRSMIDTVAWDLLIVDECHYVKNERALRTQAVFGKRRTGRNNSANVDDSHHVGNAENAFQRGPIVARRRLFLTGTPIVNRPKELWPLVQALDPNGLGANFFTFMKRYTNAHHNGYGWDFNGAANLEELQQRLRSSFMVRRLKSEVLTELPAKQRQVIVLAPVGAAAQRALAAERAFEAQRAAQRAADEAERDRAREAGDNEAFERAVARLRNNAQIAFTEMSRLRHETAVAKIPQVIEHLKDCLEDNDNKVIVFCHHHDVADAISEAFPGAAKITGQDGNVARRQAEKDRFQDDPACRLFIGSIRAAGVGLTLTASSHVVFAELDWTPGNITQAEDRAHRMGQENSVLVQHLVFDNSIDSKMAKMIIDKQAVLDAALNKETADIELGEDHLRLIEAVTAPPPPSPAPPRRPAEPAAAPGAVPVYTEIPF